MTISLTQFAAAFPVATPATQAALFARDTSLTPAIERILTAHGITEPPVVAQFLTVCGLASDGFTNFDRPVPGLAVDVWLKTRAREWETLGCNEMAAEWDWQILVNTLDVKWDMPHRDWPPINEALAHVCTALGVADESEFAPDRGASEM